jgi:hypothetical protein
MPLRNPLQRAFEVLEAITENMKAMVAEINRLRERVQRLEERDSEK